VSFANFAIEAGVNAAKPPEPAPAPEKPAATPAAPPVTLIPDAGPVGYDDDAESVPIVADTESDDSDDDGGAAPAEALPPEGVPETAEDYQPPSIDGVNWDTNRLSPIMQAAWEHDIPQEAVAAALEAYATQVQQQQADLKRQDAQMMAAVRRQLTPGERGAIDAAASAMSKDLRTALKGARTASGELLLANQEFLHLLANLNRSGGNPTPVTRAQDDAAREAEIRQVMKRDMSEYFGRSLDRELAAILRRRGVE
jgi:hypothetical protein